MLFEFSLIGSLLPHTGHLFCDDTSFGFIGILFFNASIDISKDRIVTGLQILIVLAGIFLSHSSSLITSFTSMFSPAFLWLYPLSPVCLFLFFIPSEQIQLRLLCFAVADIHYHLIRAEQLSSSVSSTLVDYFPVQIRDFLTSASGSCPSATF